MFVISVVEYGVKIERIVTMKIPAAMRIAAASANFDGTNFWDASLSETLIVS